MSLVNVFKRKFQSQDENDIRQFHILMAILKNKKILQFLQTNKEEFKNLLFSNTQSKYHQKSIKQHEKIQQINNEDQECIDIVIDLQETENVSNQIEQSNALNIILNNLSLLNQNEIPYPQMLKYLEIATEVADDIIITNQEDMAKEILNFIKINENKLVQQIQLQQLFTQEQQFKIIANSLSLIQRKRHLCQEQFIQLFKDDIFVNLKRMRERFYKEQQELNSEIKGSISKILNYGLDTFCKGIIARLLDECNKRKIYYLDLVQYFIITSEGVDIQPNYKLIQNIKLLNGMEEFKIPVDVTKPKYQNLQILLNFLNTSNINLNFNNFSEQLVEILIQALTLIQQNLELISYNNDIIAIMQQQNVQSLRKSLQIVELKYKNVSQQILYDKLSELMSQLFIIYVKKKSSLAQSYQYCPPKKIIDIQELYDKRITVLSSGKKLNREQKKHCRALMHYYIQYVNEKKILFPEALYFFKCSKESMVMTGDISKIIHIMLYCPDILNFLTKKFQIKHEFQGAQILSNFIIDNVPIYDIELPQKNNFEQIPQTFHKFVEIIYVNYHHIQDKLITLFKKNQINTLVYKYEDYTLRQGYLGEYILELLKKMQGWSQ